MAGPAWEALDECEHQVRITIRNDLEEIAKNFKDFRIISRTLYKDVTDPSSKETEEYRAHLVFNKLRDMVEGNEEHFLTFMKYLHKYSKYSKTGNMLERAYTKHGRLANSNQNQNDKKPPEQPDLRHYLYGLSPDLPDLLHGEFESMSILSVVYN